MIEIRRFQVCDNCVGETLLVVDEKMEVQNKKELEKKRVEMQQWYLDNLLDNNGRKYKEINVYFKHREI